MLSLFKNKPWVFEVRDLWPDSISAVGSMNKSSFLFKILKKIESFLYSHATKIIVVTDSFKAEILTQHKINYLSGFLKMELLNLY